MNSIPLWYCGDVSRIPIKCSTLSDYPMPASGGVKIDQQKIKQRDNNGVFRS